MGAARTKMWRTTCKGQDQEAPEILQRASTFGTSSLCRASNSSTHAGVGWNDPCSGRSIRAWVRDLAFWNRSAEKKHV